MKCWRLTDCEWYAADTLEEAIELCMRDTGLPREECFDEDHGDPAPDSMEVWADEERTQKITVRELLDSIDGPGFAFGTEW